MTKPNIKKHPKGTHQSVPAKVCTESTCVSEIGMCTWMKEAEATQSKRIAYVKTLLGTSKREVIPVWIELYGKAIKVYADVVTGTLYAEDGHCLSSTQLSIIKWGRTIGTTARQPKGISVEEAKRIQRSWASGGRG